VNEWDEWGDPRDPAARAYLASYSPYDNPPAGPRPDLLVTGSLHEPRVLIHQPAKWVARLRATGGSGASAGRVLFRPELGAGAHSGPGGRFGQLEYEAEILAFIVEAAGRDRQPGPAPPACRETVLIRCGQDWMNASRSGLRTSACVVSIPCG